MRIALVTIIEPRPDSGDGITEYAYRLLRELKKNRSNKIEVFHVLSGVRRSNAIGLLKTQMRLKSIGRDLASKSYDVIHIIHHEMGSVAKYTKERGSNARIVTTIHDIIGTYMPIYKSDVKRKIYDRMVDRNIKDAIKYSDYLIFNSSQTREETMKRYGSIPHSEVTSLGLREQILKAPIRRHKGRRFAVGYFGGFAKHKNVIAILKIAEQLLPDDNVIFHVYGNGREYEDVKKFKEDHALINVRLMGFAPEKRVVKIFSSFDVFVFPSIHEGFGFPILEAQAMGVPVIVFSKSRIPKEVSKYCIKALDEQHAAFQIRRLASGNKLVNIKKAAAYARSFTWKKNAEIVQKIYSRH